MSGSKPNLQGARRVLFRLTDPGHADLDRNIQKVEKAWARARQVLSKIGGICHCGDRWGHLMNGVEVTLLDRSPYTARCWDDDRVWINLPLFSEESDGGVEALVHEFGHRVWFQCLSREQQDKWRQSWVKAKQRPNPRWTGQCSGTISGYACTSDLEDFAEVFLAIVMGRVDEHNRQRWTEVCGCGKGSSCSRPTRTKGSPSASAHHHGNVDTGAKPTIVGTTSLDEPSGTCDHCLRPIRHLVYLSTGQTVGKSCALKALGYPRHAVEQAPYVSQSLGRLGGFFGYVRQGGQIMRAQRSYVAGGGYSPWKLTPA
jgi:hypothetical protein